MHGDFSRDSFCPQNHFSRVLMQQGRLIVDADWNEQSAIILNYLQTLTADIIGWHGGPGLENVGDNIDQGPFGVILENENVTKVNGGRYYIDGVLIEEEETSMKQDAERHIIRDNEKHQDLPNILIYLKSWEKQIVAEENLALRDIAFGGIDTTTRGRFMTEVHLLHTSLDETAEKLKKPETDAAGVAGFRDIEIKQFSSASGPLETTGVIDNRKLHENTLLPHLIAWTGSAAEEPDSCSAGSPSGYTGPENQLYRVEVHKAGTFWDPEQDTQMGFTLKWSRDNGSIAYAATVEGNTATVTTRWRDESRAIQQGNWVELIKESDEFGVMFQVAAVQEKNGVTTITLAVSAKNPPPLPAGKVLMRRWDHQHRKHFPVTETGGFLVKQEADNQLPEKLKQIGTPSVDIPLEDNLFVKLLLPDHASVKAGDHWLIPARTATGDIIWPSMPDDKGLPLSKPVPARYTRHHYAPVAIIKANGDCKNLRNPITTLTGT